MSEGSDGAEVESNNSSSTSSTDDDDSSEIEPVHNYKEIDYEELVVEHKIGAGAFGAVYSVRVHAWVVTNRLLLNLFRRAPGEGRR